MSALRNGYKGHVTQLFHKIDELVEGDFDDYITTSLNDAVGQLDKKLEKIALIDKQLLKLYEDEHELETAVLEVEELQDDITDKIARAKRYLELKSTP